MKARRAHLEVVAPPSFDDGGRKGPLEAGRGEDVKAAPDAQEIDVSALFRRYSPYVAATALALIGRDDEVDDIVQDVFLAGLRGLQGLRDPGAIKGWLSTVTVRVARRRLWWRRFRGFLRLDDAPDYGGVASRDASPEQRAMISALYLALDELPVAERLAWTLRNVEGEDLATVARLCSCSLATAKRRISSAQEALEGRIG